MENTFENKNHAEEVEKVKGLLEYYRNIERDIYSGKATDENNKKLAELKEQLISEKFTSDEIGLTLEDTVQLDELFGVSLIETSLFKHP